MIARLVKVCGMFGSAHDGERASAALLADRMVREAMLTWETLLRRPVLGDRGHIRRQRPQPHWVEVMALLGLDIWTDWERGFLVSVSARPQAPLTAKQRVIFLRLGAKAKAAALKGGSK